MLFYLTFFCFGFEVSARYLLVNKNGKSKTDMKVKYKMVLEQ